MLKHIVRTPLEAGDGSSDPRSTSSWPWTISQYSLYCVEPSNIALLRSMKIGTHASPFQTHLTDYLRPCGRNSRRCGSRYSHVTIHPIFFSATFPTGCPTSLVYPLMRDYVPSSDLLHQRRIWLASRGASARDQLPCLFARDARLCTWPCMRASIISGYMDLYQS